MSYTVQVTHALYGEHNSGSKFYELCLLKGTANDGNGCLIRRYDGLGGSDYKSKTLVQSGDYVNLKREFDALVKKKRDYKLQGSNVNDAIKAGVHEASEVLDYYKSTSNFRAINEAFEIYLKPGGAPSRSAVAAVIEPPVDGWGAW